MANTTKKKTTTKAETVTETQEIVTETPAPKKKKFNADDPIMCRSVTVGGLWHVGIKSGNIYRWVAYGDENEVDYQDLVALVRQRSNYIYKPYIVVDDNDFIEEFPQLKQFYTEQYTVDDLKGVLKLRPNDMIATIDTLPKGAKETLKSIASTMISRGELDSVRTIKALDDYFGTELSLLASLLQ